MLYREIIAVCSQILTRHINTAVWAERRIFMSVGIIAKVPVSKWNIMQSLQDHYWGAKACYFDKNTNEKYCAFSWLLIWGLLLI